VNQPNAARTRPWSACSSLFNHAFEGRPALIEMKERNRMQDETMHFVENIGLFFEQMGLPRMAGRILGVLLISDPEAQSIPDLAQFLKASKSAISSMTRLLTEVGLIERVASPIPRRVYYHFKPGGWIQYLRNWIELMSELHQITEHGLSLMRDKPASLRARLEEAHELFSMLEERFPEILAELVDVHSNRLIVSTAPAEEEGG
jgi:DNA-binding transcriptional regulator GbsR (MarR family)